MLTRLLGLETEYAIRFTPVADGQRPSREFIFECLLDAVKTQVVTRPGRLLRDEIFTENGGGFRMECGPSATVLLEGGTPECRGPSSALLYQRAQDRLLTRTLARAQSDLESYGYPGDLGLIKNCRDAAGNIYGAQENYEVSLAHGWRLLCWRLGIAVLTPPTVAIGILMWALFAAVVVVVLVLLLGFLAVALVIPPVRRLPAFERLMSDDFRFPLQGPFERSMIVVSIALSMPLAWAMRVMVWALAFRRLRRWLEPFLVSRPILSGAGTLVDGRFELSEKALGIHRRIGVTSRGRDRGIIDVGNLVKQLFGLTHGDWRGYARLYRKRQRLQLGLADSNMAEVAEYLRIATTALIIDIGESATDLAPPVIDKPLATLRRINRDLDLGEALVIQRRFQQLASEFIGATETPSLEAAELVAQWASVLDKLEQNPDTLFGELDWVTKKVLLDKAEQEPDDVRKKIDIKYHELGSGYFADLERRGLVRRLVQDDDIDEAITKPPPGSPAIMRSELINQHADIRVSWNQVRVGGRLGNTIGGKVIELDRYRD